MLQQKNYQKIQECACKISAQFYEWFLKNRQKNIYPVTGRYHLRQGPTVSILIGIEFTLLNEAWTKNAAYTLPPFVLQVMPTGL